jgi:hypothetical protein
MAIFPQGMTNVERRCNTGERKVFYALKRCLEDDYLVWHDVPIGPKARQPDFVILSPRRGLLLLEVKDWKPSTLGRATRDSIEIRTDRGPVTSVHPVRQARAYALELVDLMQRDPLLLVHEGAHKGKLIFPFGWGAVLSNIERRHYPPDQFDQIFPRNQTLLRDDLGDDVLPERFQDRLAGMFSVHFPYTLSLPQRDRVRWHLFPEVRVSDQRTLDLNDSSPSVILPDLMQVMDLQQEQVARTLGEGHRVIHGVAGSGKTMILIFRAEQLAAATRADKPILVLCYNRALAGRIEAMLRSRGADERIVVRTFHAWCEDLIKSYQIDVPANRHAPGYFEKLAAITCDAVDRGLVPAGQYTALLIDEAHDFEDAWLRVAGRMVDSTTNSLLVLFDVAQSIYNKKRRGFSFASVGIQAQGRTSILKLNYRNTAEVLALAVHCAQALLEGAPSGDDQTVQTIHPDSAGRRGPLPVLIEARSEQEECELLAERITQAHASGIALSEIAVLCRVRSQMRGIESALRRRNVEVQSMASSTFRGFDWQKPSVKIVTMHSAKGLEFPLVFVAGIHAMPMKNETLEDEVRLLYVAMTRATRELVLSAHGDSPIVERIRAALQSVTQQFSGAA